MIAMLMHGAHGAPHVHGDDPIVTAAIVVMLLLSVVGLFAAREL